MRKWSYAYFQNMENEGKALEKNSLTQLLGVISKLRDPVTGCPWDLEQTHRSLIPHLLEEAHEVADAIRECDYQNLIEELGDLLLQITLHAQIASEQQHFNFEDIMETLTKKIIRRHPHVFNTKKTINNQEINQKWEQIKLSENPLPDSISPVSDHLKIKIRSQPAMKGTMKISKKVANLGFEWNNINQVWGKFNEEINELKEALEAKEKIHAEEELGDVFFTLINIARWYSLDPEEGLSKTNKKFLKRFAYIESNLKGNFSEESPQKLKSLWQEAKTNTEPEKLSSNKQYENH